MSLVTARRRSALGSVRVAAFVTKMAGLFRTGGEGLRGDGREFLGLTTVR